MNERWYDGLVRFLHKFWWLVLLLILFGIYLIIDATSHSWFFNLVWP